jgi:hypothetical protein
VVRRVTDPKKRLEQAVAHFWRTRRTQSQKQLSSGRKDQGARSAVTGGAQMNGFISLFTDLILEAGIASSCIFHEKAMELPGFFRPTKEWDLLVVLDGQLILALEAKSQVGPSFGNNFNNRTEEALGSALDIWTAFREGAFKKTVQPWLGYVFLLEECDGSKRPVKVREPHFEVFPEFKEASYEKRYELFCRKLIRERHYSAAAFVTSEESAGAKGMYKEPAVDLSFDIFLRSLTAHIAAHAGGMK